MKKFLLAVILLLSLTNCAGAEPARNLATSVDAICWKFFATVDKGDYIFFSPYGIHAAFSIVANGATGTTRKEILDAMEVDNVDTLNDWHKNFAEIVKKNYNDDVFFAESNLLLINKQIVNRELNGKFERVLKNIYKSEVWKANFSGDITDESQRITRWVSDKTKGFIPNYNPLVLPDSMTDLLNVICFKGKWAMPFEKSATVKEKFTTSTGEKVPVELMNKVFKEKIPYYADNKFKGIKLPYSSGAAMYLVMPVDENALNFAELWNNESFAYREKFLDDLKNSYPFDGEVVTSIPKFSMTFQLIISDNLKAMGISQAFTDSAELFNIVKNTSLKINTVKHRAEIKVDEAGTEAAAVTEITMVETTAVPNPQPPRRVYFIANRPFLFVIRDVESDVILFAGVGNKI